MSVSRIALALERGDAGLPDSGRIAVYRPADVACLDGLARDRVTVFHGFRPLFDQFTGQGYDCRPAPEGAFDAAIVFLPRSKAQGRSMIADALARTDGGPVLVDGARTDGIDSMLRALRAAGCEVGPALSKAHGKLAAVNGRLPADWRQGETRIEAGFVTRPGSFSADGIDPGSALLAELLPRTLAGKVADFGAGWGFLSRAVLAHPAVDECHLVEAEWQALEAARRNVTDPRARFHWAGIGSFIPPGRFDHIVTNPPFHETRAAEPAIGQGFVEVAARSLVPRGQLWLVANRHLPYEATLRRLFGQVTELSGTNRYKIFRAERPKRPKR